MTWKLTDCQRKPKEQRWCEAVGKQGCLCRVDIECLDSLHIAEHQASASESKGRAYREEIAVSRHDQVGTAFYARR